MCAAKKAAAELTNRRDQNNDHTNQPVGGFFQKADLRAHSREDEKYGQEEHHDQILALFPDIAGETGVVRNNCTEKKCAEERVECQCAP